MTICRYKHSEQEKSSHLEAEAPRDAISVLDLSSCFYLTILGLKLVTCRGGMATLHGLGSELFLLNEQHQK